MKKLFLLACSLFIISASHADEKREIQAKEKFLKNMTKVRPYYSEKISTIDATLYGQTQDLNNTTIIIEIKQINAITINPFFISKNLFRLIFLLNALLL